MRKDSVNLGRINNITPPSCRSKQIARQDAVIGVMLVVQDCPTEMLLEVACLQRQQAGKKWPASAALSMYGLLLLL